jgi:hypothetical protein
VLRSVFAVVPRTLVVLAAGALLLAALTARPAAPALALTAGTDTFTITSSVRAAVTGTGPATRCSGPAALLAPGVARCLVYRVDNHLDVPITVRSITMGLDPRYPPPPSGCTSDVLRLPAFAGAIAVAGRGSEATPGLPISLEDAPFNQDNCQDTVLHFVFAGSAQQAATTTGGLPRTGADLVQEMLAGLALCLVGLAALLAARRSRPSKGQAR